MPPASPTPLSFAVRYLATPRHTLADGGVVAPCPACGTMGAFMVAADASGGVVSCSAGADTESPCDAATFAAALGLDLADFEAQVSALRPEDFQPVEAPEPTASLRSLLIGRDGLRDLPTLGPLIADTVLRRTVTFMAGPPASGKSFHLLSWAASVATGTPWMGRAVSRGRVLYLIAEGAFGVDDRLAAWEAFNGVAIPDDAFTAIPTALQLTDPDTLAALVALVRQENYDLVVVDTLARSAVGLDENSQADMGRFVAAVDAIRDAMTNGAVVVAHHSSKSGSGLRGSSVIEGAADAVYLSSKGGDNGGTFRLSRAKNKYGPEEDRLTFAWHARGESGVLVAPTPADRPDRAEAWAFLPTWRRLVDVLDHEQTFTRSEGWAAIKDRTDGPALARGTVYGHINHLIGVGAIRMVSQGKGGAPDRLTLDLRTAQRRGLPTARFAPLDDCSDGFLDDVPEPR